VAKSSIKSFISPQKIASETPNPSKSNWIKKTVLDYPDYAYGTNEPFVL